MATTDPNTYTGYCVKCKEKRSFPKDTATLSTMKNGAGMAKGKCPTCGTTVCAIQPKAKTA